MTMPPGLAPGQRYRCAACGNLTRFDVETEEVVRRFWHLDLGGNGVVDEEERAQVRIRGVTCRWCGGRGAVEVVAAPVAPATGDPSARPAWGVRSKT